MSSGIHHPHFCPGTGFPLSLFSSKTSQPSVNTQVCVMGLLGSVMVNSRLHPVEVADGTGEASGVGPPLPAAHSGNFVKHFSETSFPSTWPHSGPDSHTTRTAFRSWHRSAPTWSLVGARPLAPLPCQPPPSPTRCLPGWVPQADVPFPSPLLPRSRHQFVFYENSGLVGFCAGSWVRATMDLRDEYFFSFGFVYFVH